MDASISDVRVKFCGKTFTLRATNEAMVQVELATGDSWAVVMSRLPPLKPAPRLFDVSEMFAAFVVPHGSYSGKQIRDLMPILDGGEQLRELYRHVAAAVAKARPEPVEEESSEGSDAAEGDANPSESKPS